MPETIRTDWPDIWYTAFHEVEGDYRVNFRIHEWDGAAVASGYDDTPIFGADDEPLMTGHVKWDGCSDWNIDACIHFCTRDGAMKLGEAMVRCWDLAKSVFPEMQKQ